MLLSILPVPSLGYPTIQAAIDTAQSGDIVDIAAGTYAENILINKSGITIQGAGQGQTIIDGQQQGSVVTINNVDNTTIFMDCTVRNGLGLGGGIQIINASPIIRHNEIVDNAGQGGMAGGFYISGANADPIIIDNLIQHNYTYAAIGWGGGLYVCHGARPIISQNQIIDNRAWALGGAIYLYGADALIDHNIIKDNHADFEMGIFVLDTGVTTIQNNLIVHNYGTYQGDSAIYVGSGYVSINNNTIVDNRSGPWGGLGAAIDVVSDSSEIRNNIVAYNDAFGISAPGNAVTEYNLVYGNSGSDYTGGVIPGPGSLSVYPQFIDLINGDYHLAPGSPAINAGDPNLISNDPDGSRNDMGYTGGVMVQPGLSTTVQQKLVTYATATLQYFWDSSCNNVLAGFAHSWFGDGPGRVWNSSTQQWDLYTQMPRGYGSYVNVNEVTLGMVSLAAGYKMGWLTDSQQLWPRIELGLSTLRGLQTSGDPSKYTNGTFNRWYQTVGPGDVDLAPDQIYSNGNEQSSDDNGLAYLNLLNLKGLVDNLGNAIPNQQAILTLIDSILADIHLERFLVNNTIVQEFNNGVASSPWDRVATEGPLILAAMLISGKITTAQFYQIAPSLQNYPVEWDSLQHGTIPIEFPSYHSAMFMEGLRAIYGMPVTDTEFPGATFFEESVKPVFEAQMDYALANHFEALGSQVMSQTLDNWPLVEMPQGQQAQFPGNEQNHMPVPDQTQARATAPHAWFIAMDRALQLDSGDVEQIIAWTSEYESRFFDANGLGWEAAIPWDHNDTTYTWEASDGTLYYSDGGRAHEALNSAYLVLSIFDALNPNTPLTSYNPESAYLGAIARYFDSNGTQPLGTVVDGNTLDLDNSVHTVPSATLVSGSIVNGTLIANITSLNVPYVVQSGTIDATLGGTGGLAKIGVDTATLSAHNSYTGGTTVLCGTLVASNDNVLPASGSLTINNGTLDLNGKTDTIGSLLLESGSILSGTLNASSYTIESGIVTAAITGTGNLLKTTTGQATVGIVNTSNVTVNAGQLTATSITTGTLTIGAGCRLTIAPNLSGPLETISSQNSLTEPLIADRLGSLYGTASTQESLASSVSTSSLISNSALTAQSFSSNAVLSMPATTLVEAPNIEQIRASSNLSIISADSVSYAIVGPIAMPVIDTTKAFSTKRIIDAIMTRQIDTAIKYILPQEAMYFRHDSKALHRIIESRLDKSLTTSYGNDISPSIADFLCDELPPSTGKIEKQLTVITIKNRQTHFATLQKHSHWTEADIEADFDIAQHISAGKHIRQFEKAIDEVLAEENAFLAIQ